MMTYWAGPLTIAATILGVAAGAAWAQDDDLEAERARIREAVQRELQPEFQRRAAELKERFEREARALQDEFRRLVDAAVERRLAERRAGAATPPPAPPAPTGGARVGVRVEEASEGWRVLLNLGDKGGLVVIVVEPGGPAEQAGIQLNDVVTHFAGERVGTTDELKAVLARCQPGQAIAVDLIREGRKQQVRLTLGGDGGAVTPPPTPPAPPASPRERIRQLLRDLRDGALESVQRQLDGAADADERRELTRIVARKLLERLQGATDADREELLRALQQGLARYLGQVGEAARETAKDRAAAVEELLERALHGSGGQRRDVNKLLDDILGEAGKKKPGAQGDKPAPPQVPPVDPEQLRAEVERLRAKIEAEGFPQDDAGVRDMLDTLLKRLNTNRKAVRQLIDMMGGPEGAKQMVKGQLQMQGIPLTEADLDRVMRVLMEDEPGAKAKARAGKIGLSLEFTADGATVTNVAAGSPAAKAGVKVGDVLRRLGGASGANRDAVKAELAKALAGDVIEVKLRRGDQELTVTVTMEAAPGGGK